MKKLASLTLFIGISLSINAQSIFPEFSGDVLRESLVAMYKTSSVLSYDNARDTLFSRIYLVNDSLTCVYTGSKIHIPPGEDPTTYAYNNYNFQTEHTWPQSKGAENGNPKSDMHHLYPVWGSVNSSRGNYPFGELYSWNTDIWWHADTSYNTEPLDIVNECSKRGKSLNITYFEPREDHKGNVARAMFYFYTMYEPEANIADSDFFSIQHEILYKWNYEDPPDDKEIERTNKIAFYQEGKVNPYVSDISLARRAFPIIVFRTDTGSKYHRSGCQHLSQSSIATTLYDARKKYGLTSCSVCNPPYISTSYYELETSYNFIEIGSDINEVFNIYQNQDKEIIVLINQTNPIDFVIRLYDLYGRLIDIKSFESIQSGKRNINLGQYNLPLGTYLINYTTIKRSLTKKILMK